MMTKMMNARLAFERLQSVIATLLEVDGPKRRILSSLGAACSIVLALSSTARADGPMNQPSVTPPAATLRISSLPISPAEALAEWYSGQAGASTHSAGAFVGDTIAEATPRDLTALAKGLGAGRLPAEDYRKNVFRYVRNNIAVEFRYGLGKGWRGALIDQSGTPFDQAELTVKLLEVGNVAATLRHGVITLTPAQLVAWTGLPDPKLVCALFVNGGIPVGATNCADVTSSLQLNHIWVVADGLEFDPSMKALQVRAGIDIRAAMEACQTCGGDAETKTFTGALTNCDTTVGACPSNGARTGTWWARLNTNGLGTWLSARAVSMQANLEANLPMASIDAVIGGRSIIVQTDIDGVAQLPYVERLAPAPATWSSVPDAYRTTLRLQVGSIDMKFWADKLSGQRLWLSYGELHLETRPIGAASLSPILLTVNHPYAARATASSERGTYADESFVASYRQWLTPRANMIIHHYPTEIILSLGDVTNSTTRYYADLQRARPISPAKTILPALDDNQPPNRDPCSTACGADLAAAAAEIFYQQSRFAAFLDQVAEVQTTRHHAVGVAELQGHSQVIGIPYPGGALTGYFEDPKALPYPVYSIDTAVSLAPASTSGDNTAAAFEASAVLSAVAEALPTQQGADSWEQVSAPGLIADANKNTTDRKYFQVDATNADKFVSVYQENYLGSYYPTRLKDLVKVKGYSLITIETGRADYKVKGNDYRSRFYAGYFYQPNNVALLLDGAHKGGASSAATDPVEFALRAVRDHAESSKAAQSVDVEEASGAIKIAAEPDIETGTGGFPYSLPFQRTYSSEARTREDLTFNGVYQNWTYEGADTDVSLHLGGGWTHNYSIAARIISSTDEGLGSSRGISASAAIVGVRSLVDLMADPTFKRRLAAIMVADWTSKQLMANGVVITVGDKQQVFNRLPDKSYLPADGGAARLDQVSEPKIEVDNRGYDYGDVAFTYTDPQGNALKFDRAYKYKGVWGRTFKPNEWVFATGVKVWFEYENWAEYGDDIQYRTLKRVWNNLGRELKFVGETSRVNGNSKLTPPDVGHRILTVTDDKDRTVSYSRICPQWPSVPSSYTWAGKPTSKFLACDWLTVTLPGNRVWTYEYEAPVVADAVRPTYRLRNIFSPSNGAKPLYHLDYDEAGRVSVVTDRSDRTTSYFAGSMFAERDRRAEVKNGAGEVTVSYFGQYDQPLSVTGPDGQTTRFAYDDLHRLTKTTRPEGESVEQEYDLRSNVTKVTRTPRPQDPWQATPTFTRTVYQHLGLRCAAADLKVCNRPSKEIDALGYETDFSWDSATGNLVKIEGPAPVTGGARPTTTYAYESYTAGEVSFSLPKSKTSSLTDATATTTSYFYDPLNKYVLQRALVDQGGLNLETKFGFDLYGNLTSVDGPRAGVDDKTDYVWDTPSRRLLRTIDPPHLVDDDGDGVGDVSRRSATRYIRDEDGVLRHTERGIYSAGSQDDFRAYERTTTEPDLAGRPIRQTVFNGVNAQGVAGEPISISDTTYDLAGRKVCEAVRMDFAQLPAASDADACAQRGDDRITETRYEKGRVAQMVIGKHSNAATTVTFAYSPNGQRTSVTDGRDNLTDYTFDSFDRLRRIGFSSTDVGAKTTNPEDFELYYYDDNDRRTAMRRRDGRSVHFDIDALGRTTRKWFPESPTSDVYYKYDLAGRMLEARYNSATGPGSIFTYDNAGRLRTDQTFGRTITSSYDDNVNRTGIQLSDGQAWTYGFDSAGLLQSIEHAGEGALVGFTYDNLGHRSRLVRSNGGRAEYTYDGAGRLVSLKQRGPTAAAKPVSFQEIAYNPASQIKTQSQYDQAYVWTTRPSLTDHAHDGINRIKTIAALTVPTAGYDPAGNLQRNGDRKFTYDVENRLVKAEPKAGVEGAVLTLAYDPTGRLATTTATTGGDSTTTHFMYDGDRLVAEYAPGGAPLRHYVHGPGVDEPLVWQEGAETRWLHADRQGSIIAWSNLSGQQPTYTYGPWGEPSDWGPMRFRYTGQIALPEAQVYHYKARAYEPVLGRFLQTDPIGQEGGWNLYAYVDGDPTNNADPPGTQPYGSNFPPQFQPVPVRPNNMQTPVVPLGQEPYGSQHAETTPVLRAPNPYAQNRDPSGLATFDQWNFRRDSKWLNFFNPSRHGSGIDNWSTTVLKKGSELVRIGYPGGNYAVSKETWDRYGGNLNRFLQAVQAPPRVGDVQITQYRLETDTVVATSIARQNTQFGSGGAQQFYVPSWQGFASVVNQYRLRN